MLRFRFRFPAARGQPATPWRDDAPRPPRGAPLFALVAGLLHTAAFAPVDAWGLQIAALALLAAALRGASPGAAFKLGWLFAAAWLSSGLWWLTTSMHRYGGMPAWMAWLALLVLCAALALYYGAAFYAWARWAAPPLAGHGASIGGAAIGGWHRGASLSALGWAAAFGAAELARASWLTGFPWIAAGYAHTDGPLAHWAPWIGVYGIGALAAWLGAGLAFGAQARRLRPVLAPAALLALGFVLPQDFTAPVGVLRVSLLQPNVPQDVKFDEAHIRRSLTWHLQSLEAAQGDLVVTPESSLPLSVDQIDRATWAQFEAPFRRADGPPRAALVGVFTGGPQEGYMNSVVGLAREGGPSDGQAYRYGKRHLLPFGEYIPPGFGWFVEQMAIPIGDQMRGHQIRPLGLGAQRVRPLICYEQLFGEDFAEAMFGPEAATVLVNVSNLAWFGPYLVQDQDLQFSRMRALEFQRPLLRATNTGSTAAVDHTGRVVARLAPEIEGRLEAQVEGRLGATPYARWLASAGLAPLWLAMALGFGAAALRVARRARG